jgi:hypothetical protein
MEPRPGAGTQWSVGGIRCDPAEPAETTGMGDATPARVMMPEPALPFEAFCGEELEWARRLAFVITGSRDAADTDLARLLPALYRNVLQYDEPTGLSSHDGGRAASVKAPPSLPERGTPHELNLAFERIQLLAARSRAEAKLGSLRVYSLAPPGIQIVSLTPATRIEGSE